MCLVELVLSMDLNKLKYEFYCKHLEYHDSNVFKLLSIYFAFVGLFMFKIEEFYSQIELAVALVISFGILFFVFLLKTQLLLSDLKALINEFHEDDCKTIWPRYLAKGWYSQFHRTSVLGCIVIAIFTGLLLWHLILHSTESSCK